MINDGNQHHETDSAEQWYKWLEAAHRYEYNWQTNKAIAAYKPSRKKSKVQMQGLQTLDLQERNQEDDSDGVIS